jgi:Uma2 family endonuclease
MTEIVFSGAIRVPFSVQDLDSFRCWSLSDDFPDRGNISFLNNQLWVDLSPEGFVHNQIKFAIFAALFQVIRQKRLGRAYADGMRLVHPEAGLSTEPDAMFASLIAFQQQQVQLPQGEDSLELIDSPDMVLEVVSPTSVEKDTIRVVKLYHKARVREYWLVNPFGDVLDFKIYRYAARKFTEVRPNRGWHLSEVFGHSFRLTETIGELNLKEFTLEVR